MKPTKTPGAAKAPEPKAAPAAETATYDWSQFQGASGFENTSQEDLGIPFLQVCQKGSPEIDPSNPEHLAKRIEGISVGDIFNTVTRTVIYKFGPNSKRPSFVPCFHDRVYVEWKQRSSGGGIVKTHRDPAILNEITSKDDSNHDILRNGNLLATTSYFYGLLLIEGEKPAQCVIGMTSTQLKNARFWLNMMIGLKVDGPNGKFMPPMFSHRYLLGSKPESNAKGSWMGWSIEIGGMLSDRTLIADAQQASQRIANVTKPRNQIAAVSAPSSTVDTDDVPM